MAGIFISYRRDDSPGFAGRLAEDLEAAFGAGRVFRDIDDIRPGEDFVVAITDSLRSVDVLLAVIGPGWLAAARDGARRLDDPEDFVRREIELALAAGKPVWPVLIGGATMPDESDLPASIRPLARRQAVVLADGTWKTDVARLVEALQTQFALRPRPRRAAWLVGLGLLALLGGWAVLRPLTAPPADSQAAALSGRWEAKVRYDWGAEHDERFELRVEAAGVGGTASYLGLPRLIEQGGVGADGEVSFVTRSEAVAGETTRQLTHRYRGRLRDGDLHLVLETGGGFAGAQAVAFVARRPAGLR